MYPAASPDLDILQTPQSELDTIQTDVEDENAAKEREKQEELDDKELNSALLELVEYAEKEDRDVRWPLLAKCKRNDNYFNNLQNIFYDYVARDFRTIESVMTQLNKNETLDIKNVNIYRAHAESLIAALSVELPNMEVAPDDAENPDDIETADTYQKAGAVIAKHNAANLLLIKSLTTQFNCGTVFGLTTFKTDPKYGTTRKPSKFDQVKKKYYDIRCQYCSDLLDSGVSEEQLPNYQNANVECPSCDYVGTPGIYIRFEFETEATEWEDTPKGRSHLDVFGPNYVKVSLYARRQENVGYLILRLEDHIAKWRSVYNEYDNLQAESGDIERYERWSRLPVEYEGALPTDICTGRYAWFRPWYYYTIENEDRRKLLLDKYPDGVHVTVIGDKVVDKKTEMLDDRWTISFDPRANYVHAEAPGNTLVPLQDSTTDIFNLGIQSIEYGIPETFVHPKTVNLEKYSKTKAAPGMMVNAMPPDPGSQLSEGFHTVQASTLSSEYTTFARDLNSITQFITGDFPSIFGGTAGENTATEYVESQGRALQRLQLTWAVIKHFWSHLLFKSTKDYLSNIKEDERFTEKQNGSYINVWIRKSSLTGKVGHVEPDINGQLPQSWSQKRQFVMQMLEMQNPVVGQILLNPNNTELLKRATGLPEFYIPGEKDRNKQWAEFYLLSQQEPIGEGKPSVDIDIDADDHQVHMMVLKDILVSPAGIQLYKENPAGYQNNIFHYRAHELALQAKTMSPAEGSSEGEKPPTAVQQ